MRRSIILLCLVPCLIGLWLMRSAFQAAKPDATKSAPTTKSPPAASTTAKPSADDLAELYINLISAPQSNKEPVPFKSRGRVHLKPGESAVIWASAVAGRMPKELFPEVAVEVMKAAREIERRLQA